ncbi:protein GAST1-like [Pyrus ussuriensis x Pyrus communis]|uniref:Protein GAST1-like n=1 Tax=Pyrus ussuriensis x Pyrus communis TaxID=2448454 RepID=A0A5N5GQ07_9ROSA|nr:protein GAST1-like [Pyrus ussuriensis x Pyrus communis]
MATKLLSIFMLCVALILVLLEPNQGASTVETLAFQQQHQGDYQPYGTTQGSLRPQECAPRCTSRCSATAYKKPCLFFCQKCCAKCLCVPPGTYGNKQVCPCYNNWKTKRGGPKCP